MVPKPRFETPAQDNAPEQLEQPTEPTPRRWQWSPRKLRFGARNPMPLQDPAIFWRNMAQLATILMAVIIFGAFLYFARALIVPLMAAAVVSMTLGPLAARATRLGLPAWVPAIVIVLVLGIGFYLAIVFLADPASDLISRSGEIGATVREKFRFMDRPLAAIRELQTALVGSSGLSVDVNKTDLLAAVAMTVTPAALQFVLFFATLFFFVFGRDAFRHYVVNFFTTRAGRLRALRIINDTEVNLSGYLITVTIINLGVGIFATLVTYLLGFPAPFLWGALAFALNYIPYVGPGIVQVTLFVIGLLTFDTLWPALIAPAIFMTFTFFEGNILVPSVVGRQLLLHPLAVFLSIAFWGWLWGAMGAFLATPILILATVVLDHLYPRSKNNFPQ